MEILLIRYDGFMKIIPPLPNSPMPRVVIPTLQFSPVIQMNPSPTFNVEEMFPLKNLVFEYKGNAGPYYIYEETQP